MTTKYKPHIDLLMKAFDQDPLFLELFQGENRKEKMRKMFDFLIKRNQLSGGILLTDDEKAPKYIALVECPVTLRKTSLSCKLKYLCSMAVLTFKIPFKTLRLLTKYQNKTAELAPGEPHYYLTIVGVDPFFQGQGIGGEVLKKLDEMRTPAYPAALDTENIKNVAYYERFGYRLTNKETVGELVIYCMRKT